MSTLNTILYVFAAVCFLLAALGWGPVYGREGRTRSVSLVALGLFFWVLVYVIAALRG